MYLDGDNGGLELVDGGLRVAVAHDVDAVCGPLHGGAHTILKEERGELKSRLRDSFLYFCQILFFSFFKVV